jgi:hypothetical protein
MTAREIVETAVGLQRTGYAFPGIAERAAAAIEVRVPRSAPVGQHRAGF